MITAIALLAACLLGIGFVLQQRAASRAPLDDILRPRLIVHLLHSRQWLFGIASMISGQLLSAVVLGQASVSRIEPLLAANLLVALIVASMVTKRSLRAADWFGCLLLGSGLAGFLLASDPSAARATVASEREWLAIVVIAGCALGLVLVSRLRPLGEQATMLAGAAGCLAGLQDGFTRSTVIGLENDPVALLRQWEPYAVIAVALMVILLQQSAFRAGTLRQALPALTVGEPLAGIAFGIVAFGDRLRLEPWAIAVSAAGLVAMIAGVYILASSALLAHAVGETSRPRNSDGGLLR